jgi:hypothetical protein
MKGLQMTDLEAVQIARWSLMNGHKLSNEKRIAALGILTEWEVKMMAAQRECCENVIIVHRISDVPQANVFPSGVMGVPPLPPVDKNWSD